MDQSLIPVSSAHSMAKSATRCADTEIALTNTTDPKANATLIDPSARTEELASLLLKNEEKLWRIAPKALSIAKESGQYLLELRELSEHGEWSTRLKEISARCQFSVRTAQLYMQINRRWEFFEQYPREKLKGLSLREAGRLLATNDRSNPLASDDADAPHLKVRRSRQCLAPFCIIQATLNTFLRGITLDPASEPEGKHIPAPLHYTEETDGLSDGNPWPGSVFLHPPHEVDQGPWIDKLAREVKSSEFEECVALLPVNSDSSSFATLLSLSPSLIFVRDTLPFPGQKVKGPLMIAYVGEDHVPFSRAFSGFGPLVRPASSHVISGTTPESAKADPKARPAHVSDRLDES